MAEFYVWDDDMQKESEADVYEGYDAEAAVIDYLDKSFADMYEYNISDVKVNVREKDSEEVKIFDVAVRSEPVFSAWEYDPTHGGQND